VYDIYLFIRIYKFSIAITIYPEVIITNIMEIAVGSARFKLFMGDITEQGTEAIVNAANSGLMGEAEWTVRYTGRGVHKYWKNADLSGARCRMAFPPVMR
jgi:hypothetical protein